MKKFFSILLSIIMVLSAIPMLSLDSFAADPWTFNAETGVLTISGAGKMNNYQTQYDKEHSPWYSFRDDITSVVIESGILSIGNAAFYKCSNLKSVSIPNTVKIIGSSAFAGCSSLTSVTIPDSVEEIDTYAFQGCSSLENVVIPGSVTMIEHQAFGSCTSLKNITIMDGVTTIAAAAFLYCSSLVNVTIPDSVTYIGAMSFMECTSLVSIIIPESVTTIMSNAFQYCSALTDIYYGGSKEQWNQINGSTVENARVHYNYGKFTGIKGDYFYKNDVRQRAYQLVEFEGDYYFINNSHKLAKNTRLYLGAQYVDGFMYADGTPFQPGYYEFDENGKMVMLNGVVGDYFYKNNVRQKAYQLVKFEGDFYFINTSHKVAKNTRLYLSEKYVNGFTYADGTPLKPGYYEFDENGKMVMLNGVVGDYFYKDNVRLNAYQIVEFEGNYYFVYNSHKLAKNTRLYLSEKFVEGTDLEVGYYNFDADGKIILE